MLTIANIVAIIAVSILNKLGETKKGSKFNGNGALIRKAEDISKLENKYEIKLTAREVSAGLILSVSFYVLGNIFSNLITIPEFSLFGIDVKIDIHRFA